ncbi:unnamed protein product [Larinioides sclopetarius]|uniref:Papilin n=1 Tax=Larinioides sclopetarius TaxID=280406 RepID=A0AAV1Z5T6_9ARAC
MKNRWNCMFLSKICAIVTFHYSLHNATAIPLVKSEPLARHHRQVYPTDRQPEVSYQNRTAAIQIGQNVHESGPWGPWSANSDCSRFCGGGIAYQDRICLDVRANGRHSCIGVSKRYFFCNVDDCPPNSEDFRAEQCKRFNHLKYKGNYHNWVPYYSAQTLCELNCMPKGGKFYARMDRRVIDGTRCRADGSLDVCVDGQCMEVGCDNILKSATKVDECGVCGGNGSSCSAVKGIFDEDDFEIGYNDLLLLPSGATSILIQEVQPTSNYLALRNAAGVYHLNGNWRLEYPKEINIAGTVFRYERKGNHPEVLRAPGPTIEPIYVVLLYQEKNLGISYEYSIPATIKIPQRDSYEWIIDDSDECSQSCGGGVQIRTVSCIRKSNGDIVDKELCDPTLKPAVNASCNTKPCPPRWDIGEWSTCSKSCGGGTQFRLVLCQQLKDSRTVLVPNEMCEEPKSVLMRACNVEIPCPDWALGEWSECDRTCGNGSRTRTVECSWQGETIDPSWCDAAKKPGELESCTLGSCEELKWIVSKWSRCDLKCGSGNRNRTVKCFSNRETLDPSVCDAENKPVEFQSCTLGPCEDVKWMVSEWTRCQDACDASIQSRQVHCADKHGVVFPQDSCDAVEMPKLSRPCVKPWRCEIIWHASEWSECNRRCGKGNRTRTVECSSQGEVLDPSLCDADKKPAHYESCTLGPCEKVKWTVSEWSKCQNSCLPCKRSRQVHCSNEDGMIFPDDACNATEIPELTRPCPKPARCETMWHASEWSECDRMCGKGNRTRIVECYSDKKKLASSFCDANKKPIEYQSCTLGSCEEIQWKVSEWSRCEDFCNSKIQSRQVHCVNVEGVSFPNSACNAIEMPVLTKSCPKSANCEAKWHVSGWSECGRTCGNGNRTRTVECSSQGKTLDPSLCDADKKPIEYESCTLGLCEELKWTVSEWSKCEDSCSPSIQSRQVHCMNEERAIFPNTSCNASQMPEVTKSCLKHPRCDAVWLSSEWSECNRKCGNGNRTRTVECSSKGEKLDPSSCDADKMPVEYESCTLGSCREVKWIVSEWSKCQDSCNRSFQSRQIHCANEKGVVLFNSSCDASKMPELTKPCPKPVRCEAAWHASKWSECNRPCGSGNRTRTVECSSEREKLNSTFCDADRKPAEFQSCTLGPCEEVKWTASEWSWCEDSCSPSIQTRQVQCTNDEGVIFSDIFCDAAKMPKVTKPCPKPEGCEAIWQTSEWSECNSPCGNGNRTRTVECSFDGKTLDPSFCDADKKPAEYENCTLGQCEEVKWTVSEWSECEDSCIPSTQSRQVHCVNTDGIVFPNISCDTSQMPEMTRPCPKLARCEAVWHASEWSECDRPCGNGNRTRTVECSSERKTLDPSLCDGDKKPIEYESCILGPCEEVKWAVSEWIGCEDSCNPGIQSRQVHCMNDAGVVYPEMFCNASEVPEVVKPCPKPVRCRATWRVSEWSECDRKCGNGNRTRTVECSSDSGTIDSSVCDAGKKPVEIQTCIHGQCEDVKWIVSDWSGCEDSCSSSTQSRQVHCVNQAEVVFPVDACDTAKMPEVTLPCPKPERCKAMWHVSEWSKCNPKCGNGNRTRTVECSSKGEILDSLSCDADKKPVKYKNCILGECEELKWTVSEWSGVHVKILAVRAFNQGVSTVRTRKELFSLMILATHLKGQK